MFIFYSVYSYIYIICNNYLSATNQSKANNTVSSEKKKQTKFLFDNINTLGHALLI